ncbi:MULTISPECIES: hypothetical protein [unclassified Pseudomonas]|uniref:hypothetical protein n=1 Tax=unclassified Pseudomonas TaxID=196821 RepID=UPI0015C020AE|nr:MULTISPECIES: hypothetical protein [unclassified Pseudomonas]MCS4247209.1 hypothetical protein [Pseudomonas sp. BIGb0164]NWE18466.1 hypothetical protein [Pseudomonas sp. P7548]
MSIPSITPPSTNNNFLSAPGTKPGTGNSSDDLLDKAEAIAREGFELSLKAKQITNKYAAAKEVR